MHVLYMAHFKVNLEITILVHYFGKWSSEIFEMNFWSFIVFNVILSKLALRILKGLFGDILFIILGFSRPFVHFDVHSLKINTNNNYSI